MPTVSLCMIVKNEAEWLPKFFPAIKELVDEIIVVDTGSMDGTQDIVRSAGAKLFEQQWDDDFATPRNFAIGKATKEWIFALDADEFIAPQDFPRFRELLIWKAKDPRIGGFRFTQRNYTNDRFLAEFVPNDPQDGYTEQQGFLGYIPAHPVRLWRNRAGIAYSFLVHEAVEPSILKQKMKIVESGIPIHHFRDLKGQGVMVEKGKFYTRLIEKHAKAPEHQAKAFYELGLSQKAEGKMDEAAVSFKTVLAIDPKYRQPYSNLAEVYVGQGKIDEAIVMLHKAIEIKPIAADYYNLGVLLMRQKKYDESAEALRNAIKMAPTRIEFYTTLSAVYAQKQEFHKALKVFDICIKHNPQRFEPYNSLGLLLFKLQKYPEALKCFRQGHDVARAAKHESHPDYPKLLINLAETHVKMGEQDKAKEIFEELIQRQPE
ncbi:MAG TPA: tetratricopeptide repeat protein, partial [Candidatus Nanoarchaeia archaeon]|nr:tetratricopeptide repeat protein [Candidatus Nanoarchaeia archaeon]